MNSFAELIRNRRSVRRFTGEKIKSEDIELIIDAALLAPTSKNCRSWKFIIVEDKEMLKQLALSKPSGAAFIEHCALAIVVLSNPEQSSAHVEDTSIAAIFIQLQAEDLGLGSCWCQIAGRKTASGQDSEQYIRDLLNIPSNFGVACIIAIGHKERAESPHGANHKLIENVYFEKFQFFRHKES